MIHHNYRPHIDKDILYQWYVAEKMTLTEVANKIGRKSTRGIKVLLIKYGIKIRTISETNIIRGSLLGSKNPSYGKSGELSSTWLGGKSSWKKGRAIRPSTKKKKIALLGGKCFKCGATERLTLNHNPPWRICRSHDLKFLEVLCLSCHMRQPHATR